MEAESQDKETRELAMAKFKFISAEAGQPTIMNVISWNVRGLGSDPTF